MIRSSVTENVKVTTVFEHSSIFPVTCVEVNDR